MTVAAPMMPVMLNAVNGMGKVEAIDLSSLSPVPYPFDTALWMRKGPTVKKVVERRQRRMIKNKELAWHCVVRYLTFAGLHNGVGWQNLRSRMTNCRKSMEHDVVLTIYGVLSTAYKADHRSIFHRMDWYRIVLDEAHAIKSPKTKGAKTAFRLSLACRWDTIPK